MHRFTKPIVIHLQIDVRHVPKLLAVLKGKANLNYVLGWGFKEEHTTAGQSTYSVRKAWVLLAPKLL